MMQAEVYDIAFVDFLMPVMNGIQMVTRYRKWEKEQEDREKKQYIVGISANADGRDIEEGKRQGLEGTDIDLWHELTNAELDVKLVPDTAAMDDFRKMPPPWPWSMPLRRRHVSFAVRDRRDGAARDGVACMRRRDKSEHRPAHVSPPPHDGRPCMKSVGWKSGVRMWFVW